MSGKIIDKCTNPNQKALLNFGCIIQLSTNYGLAQIYQIDFRMASEATKRAEEDRMRRIQLQEEQDLAYAIALSKAEAVSLKQN